MDILLLAPGVRPAVLHTDAPEDADEVEGGQDVQKPHAPPPKGHLQRLIDELIEELMDGLICGRVSGWVDGWMDGLWRTHVAGGRGR